MSSDLDYDQLYENIYNYDVLYEDIYQDRQDYAKSIENLGKIVNKYMDTNKEMCEEIIYSNFYIYAFVDKQNYDFSLKLLKKEGPKAMLCIKDQTDELCLSFIDIDNDIDLASDLPGLGLGLFYIKNPSERVYLYAVKINSWYLQYIPKEKQTEEICLAAAEENLHFLEFIEDTELREKIRKRITNIIELQDAS